MSDSYANLWTAAHHAPLSLGFPRQKYWSGQSFPSPGVPTSPALLVYSLPLSHHESPIVVKIINSPPVVWPPAAKGQLFDKNPDGEKD